MIAWPKALIRADADGTLLPTAQAWEITLLIVAVMAVNRWVKQSRPRSAHELRRVVLAKRLEYNPLPSRHPVRGEPARPNVGVSAQRTHRSFLTTWDL